MTMTLCRYKYAYSGGFTDKEPQIQELKPPSFVHMIFTLLLEKKLTYKERTCLMFSTAVEKK